MPTDGQHEVQPARARRDRLDRNVDHLLRAQRARPCSGGACPRLLEWRIWTTSCGARDRVCHPRPGGRRRPGVRRARRRCRAPLPRRPRRCRWRATARRPRPRSSERAARCSATARQRSERRRALPGSSIASTRVRSPDRTVMRTRCIQANLAKRHTPPLQLIRLPKLLKLQAFICRERRRHGPFPTHRTCDSRTWTTKF